MFQTVTFTQGVWVACFSHKLKASEIALKGSVNRRNLCSGPFTPAVHQVNCLWCQSGMDPSSTTFRSVLSQADWGICPRTHPLPSLIPSTLLSPRAQNSGFASGECPHQDRSTPTILPPFTPFSAYPAASPSLPQTLPHFPSDFFGLDA